MPKRYSPVSYCTGETLVSLRAEHSYDTRCLFKSLLAVHTHTLARIPQRNISHHHQASSIKHLGLYLPGVGPTGWMCGCLLNHLQMPEC